MQTALLLDTQTTNELSYDSKEIIRFCMIKADGHSIDKVLKCEWEDARIEDLIFWTYSLNVDTSNLSTFCKGLIPIF